tara:strand:+ start:5426 stop:11533 length:6108 start_codon:yes stop_codon:yes gene_type:complete
MKKIIPLIAPILFLTFGFFLIGQALPKSLMDQWEDVESEIKKGLPKTAIEKIDPLIKQALKDGAHAVAIRAIGQKINLEGAIQGNKAEEKIARLEDEITKAPEALKPMMRAVLSNWYWQYFQQNRWRFAQRTRTTEAPGEDITTWDLPRILAEIDKQFQKTLSYHEVLKKEAIGDYDFLLNKGNVPESYRPTLYDFVVHDALRFYSAGEQAGSKAQDSFVLSADSPIFASAKDFMGWEIDSEDDESPKIRAIKLYQDLLNFHKNGENQDAFIEADLLRLRYGYNQSFGEEKNARYKAALKRFTQKWAEHEMSARAMYRHANVLRGEGELVEAHKMAKRGISVFPESVGAKECRNLINQIEAKSSLVKTERVWNAPFPKIQLRYRNLTKAYFRVVSYDWVTYMRESNRHSEYIPSNERKQWLAKKPVKEWSVDLPPTKDFKERVEKITPPKDLKPGSYFLFASYDPEFKEQENEVSYSSFWVSDLSVVTRTQRRSGNLEGFVLNAISGEPIQGAKVRSWKRENSRKIDLETVRTDANGLFSIKQDQARIRTLVSYQGQTLASTDFFYVIKINNRSRPNERSVFFTDRSLYRPGQTIRYKGVSYHIDQDKDNYKVIPNCDLTVVFRDSNNQEIARAKHRTNDYGSFEGSFTSPRDRLMGRMHLQVEGSNSPRGSGYFNVEEYKRPKFQVTVDAPAEPAVLNRKVKVRGSAMAYTGAAINDAQVRYRVVRQVRFPPWLRWQYWWRPLTVIAPEEIAQGTARTGADGSFEVEFAAKPDPGVLEKDEPTFNYTIYADVVDATGETRTGETSVNVGFVALQASLSAEDWQTAAKPVKVSLKTTSLDGDGRIANGSLKIHRLKEPKKVQRASLGEPLYPTFHRGGLGGGYKPEPDLSNTSSWELGEVVATQKFTTDGDGNKELSFTLEEGAYRAVLETRDRFGKEVKALLPILVLNPKAKRFGVKIPNHVAARTWRVEPGDSFNAFWGTGYRKGRAFVEIVHRNKVLQSYWTDGKKTQAKIEQKVSEAMRGGFTLRVTYVRENRAYLTTRQVEVPWTNKDLEVKWERFTSKLEPAAKETWTAVITGPDARKAVAEMVATLYDESLDAYQPHDWQKTFSNLFRREHSNLNSRFENSSLNLRTLHGGWKRKHESIKWSHRSWHPEMVGSLWGYYNLSSYGYTPGRGPVRNSEKERLMTSTGAYAFSSAQAHSAQLMRRQKSADTIPYHVDASLSLGSLDESADFAMDMREASLSFNSSGGSGAGPRAGGIDLSKVSARKNLNETAFFFPKLISDKDGIVRMEFTMPEALTKWKFLGFAHDKEMRSGFLSDSMVTAKDIMVQPNPPRFLREGDKIEFTVKVSNQSPTIQKGTVRLTFHDARTNQSVDGKLGNKVTDLNFEIPAKQSRTYSWKISVPDDLGVITYKAVGGTGKISDGEEGYLPVLSRRIFVTESMPLPIRGAQTKKFNFEKLMASGNSDTIKHKNFTVQMVSNPSWYAVMALPYLMEFPHECSEQTFNRLYANSLAREIAHSDPKIRRIFDQWKGTKTLDSPLEKNEDLKSVALMETPWVRQAKSESEARRNVGILFDDNRLNDEKRRTFQKLKQMQLSDGAWPWFPGGRGNDYITLYITTGFGRLGHLGVDVDPSLAIKSLNRLDNWINKTYRSILKNGKKENNHLSSTIALYLYGRSFFLDQQKINPNAQEAVNYFLGQAREYWLKLGNRQSQGHVALALHRFGKDKDTPMAIVRSLKERSVSDDEMGMFWKDEELSWWWHRAPIETQAVMIEAFDEIMNDQKSVEECKVWLLKQKQTQDWKTTKATADAVYALVLRGSDLLASDELVKVSLADRAPIKPENVEAGTGYYEKRFVGPEIKPDFGKVTVTKVDEGVAWGSVHWQYMEDISKITPHEGTPLKIKKTLYSKEYTKKGPVISPVRGPVKVGDELVVRIELRTDRDMEYVHMKDHRGSGTEPVNVLSTYKYQDGLSYYQSTRDTASHFYLDYLPKGTYVFEYSVRVQHRGEYQTGMTNVQCMYAPEFNSHSQSISLVVE